MSTSSRTVSPRTYYVYELWDGPRKVYIGITSSLDRRMSEHQYSKQFTRMVWYLGKRTIESARKLEAELLEKYRRSHGGKNPKYNKTNHG